MIRKVTIRPMSFCQINLTQGKIDIARVCVIARTHSYTYRTCMYRRDAIHASGNHGLVFQECFPAFLTRLMSNNGIPQNSEQTAHQ